MRSGKRQAIANTADRFRDLSRSDLERALIIQRSTTAPDVIAALVEPDVDVDEITRVVRGVLSGERRAVERFLDFNNERINSLARVLCLAGDDRSVDRGLDILRAQARLLPGRTLPQFQRLLLADALIYRRRFDEAAEWLADAGFEGMQRSRYALSIFNPFRAGNDHAMPVDEWVHLFNEFMSPSGQLAPVELDGDGNILPFERLSASCDRRVEGPLVTVVMSSFRPDESLFGSIRSILNQSWKSLELLVIDDASGPEYDEIYRRVARMDTRIRLIRQKVNGGTYLIRNKGLSLARGEFIGFQDDDDWSHPERIERQLEPLLKNPSVVATQSLCFRTDEHLDPVRIGYRKHLRRNESSLLFRAEAVRRIGFFHFTRKGGDSEYRLRLEAAFGRPTTIVGDEALAIIRLTPGSLSRDEFAPGFRHPSRFVYAECFKLLHSRAELEDMYFRSFREYCDSFVPAKFQPRRRATETERIDVVIAADLRSCASTNSWVTSVCTTLYESGLRVGLAHYVGLRFAELGRDLMTPEVADLFVDGIAEPVEFGESRDVGAVVVGDAALLQYSPWQPTPWTVQRVFARRGAPDNFGDIYDDASASFTSLRQFGVRPTWIGAESNARTVRELVRSDDGAVVRSTSVDDIATVVSSTADFSLTSPKSWRCSMTAPSLVGAGLQVSGLLRTTPVGVPHSASRSRVDGRWCVVIGWPSFGFETSAEPSDASRVLLDAWSRGRGEFERQYADLGGSCVVVRGDGHTVAVRTTSAPHVVRRDGDTVLLSSPRSTIEGHVLGDRNLDELVLSGDGEAHFNPIATPVTHDGALFDELRLMVQWDFLKNTGGRIRMLLDDDQESAIVLGILRESVENVDIAVRHATSHIAKFLRSRFVDFSILPPDSASATHVNGAGNSAALGPGSSLITISTSYRFRRLLDVALKTPASDAELDALWMGLSSLTRGQPSTTGASAEAPESAVEPTLPILRADGPERARVEDSVRGESRTLRIAPDIARGEEHPLSALILPGSTGRLIVSLSSERNNDESGSPIQEAGCTNTTDHHLIIEDTTHADDPRMEYGWFFGSENDNLVLRYVQLVRQLAAHLNCSEVVVRGHGRTAVPAVLLASLLRRATALIVDPEAIAGEADRKQFACFLEVVNGDVTHQRFVEAYAHRLKLRDILAAAPTDLRVVVAREGDYEACAGYAVVQADTRTVAIDATADDWLVASV